MATDLQTILSWFKTGLKPTQAQFWASWSSFWHKDEAIPQSSVSGLTNVLNAKVENDQFNAHKVANDAHAALFQTKEDKTQKGAPGGYAPLDELTKLAAQYLNIVNDLVTGGATALLSAEQGKVLQTQISTISTLLASDNVNLDTVQELVDAIETVQLSLSSILVNDLTTGGTTKALTAEMGKLLQANKVDKDDSAYYNLSLKYGNGNGPETINSNKSNIKVIADIGGDQGIDGFIFGLGYQPYDGKLYTITNALSYSISLSSPFFKCIEYTLEAGSTFAFIYDSNSGSPVFRQLSVIEPADKQVRISGSNFVIHSIYNKKTLIFSSNCTVTVPSALPVEFSFVFRTLAGVTVTWAITSPFVWETTPTTTPEKTTGSFMRLNGTNAILLDF